MTRLSHHVRRASSLLLGASSHLSQNRRARRVFTDFAKSRGLVYFTDFDTSRNDSQVVRGITLGMSVKDINYIFGTHDAYDIICVQRETRAGSRNSWTVMAIDLHTAVNLPHMLIGKKSEVQPLFESLFGTYRELQQHEFAVPDNHHKKFIKHFTLYAPPAHASIVEYVISPEVTNAIVDHVENIVIEIEAGTVYLTVNKPSLTSEYLDKLMHYGIEFAKHIDKKMGAD